MHVQRDKDTAAQHGAMHLADLRQDAGEERAVEGLFEQRAQLIFPRHPDRVILQAVKERGLVGAVAQGLGADAVVGELRLGCGERQVEVVEQPLPASAHAGDLLQGLGAMIGDQGVAVDDLVLDVQRQVTVQEFGEMVAELDLVLQRQFDVDAFDAVAVFTHAWQGDDHVFVDLERIGMTRNGGGAAALEPEALALLRADRDETFGAAAIGHAYDF